MVTSNSPSPPGAEPRLDSRPDRDYDAAPPPGPVDTAGAVVNMLAEMLAVMIAVPTGLPAEAAITDEPFVELERLKLLMTTRRGSEYRSWRNEYTLG